MNEAYEEMLAERTQFGSDEGFEPTWIPDQAFGFQAWLIDWAVRKGRGAIFAECGLGKTLMQLAWAENVIRHTNKPVLLLTPLAVAQQTKQEAEKFGVDAVVSRDGKVPGSKVVVTNYERLHYFDRDDFAAVVCDESSAIKDDKSQRKKHVTEFMRHMRYRLLCTATAAPNDFFELGTSSEALGYLGFRDMITTFFKQETQKDHLGWGRAKYRFAGHAERPFWRWVCSWARSIRKPSDLGFSDEGFELPPLREHEVIVANSTPREGLLFAVPARNNREEIEERRITLTERCERAAEIVTGDDPATVWCHLNPEGDLLEKLIPDAVQVSGSMSDDAKEEALVAFTRGEIRVLVTKPKIGCWGLNWQHCSNVVTFPSHSFEQYYQLVRRFYRFGQEKPVDVSVIATEGEAGAVSNLKRKQRQIEEMFSRVVASMHEELGISAIERFPQQEEVPQWL